VSLGPPPAQRKLELTLGPLAPWHTVIQVHAVTTNHGRHSSLPHDWLFEVSAEWFGPPAVGFPPSLTPVSGRDVCVVTSLEQARTLAELAALEYAAGGDHAPDLRALVTRDRDASAWSSYDQPNS
jgi:hypothetical protein